MNREVVVLDSRSQVYHLKGWTRDADTLEALVSEITGRTRCGYSIFKSTERYTEQQAHDYGLRLCKVCAKK